VRDVSTSGFREEMNDLHLVQRVTRHIGTNHVSGVKIRNEKV